MEAYSSATAVNSMKIEGGRKTGMIVLAVEACSLAFYEFNIALQ